MSRERQPWRWCGPCRRVHQADAPCLTPDQRREAETFPCWWGWDGWKPTPYLVIEAAPREALAVAEREQAARMMPHTEGRW